MSDVLNECFPRSARLLTPDAFSSIFRTKPFKRTQHFTLYILPTQSPARLGVVIGRKVAPRAVTRNLIRRFIRETFRIRRFEFDGKDILIRMHERFNKKKFPSASSLSLKKVCQNEITYLFEALT